MPRRKIVFVWENFGPQHIDRLEATQRHYGLSATVVGIELSSKSASYDWKPSSGTDFERIILSEGPIHFFDLPLLVQIIRLLRASLRQGHAVFALCHYERPTIFLTALLLRLLGRHVVTMNDSKFDDYDRWLPKEWIKFILYMPYQGALVASRRAAAYLAFLGIPRDRIGFDYDNLSRERIVRLSGSTPAPLGCPHEDRDFLVVARLIPKKNLFLTLDAFARYRNQSIRPRRLLVCGNGPLEADLRAHCARLELDDSVSFAGFVQSDEVAKHLAKTLALLLLSVEDQFGQVVLEAQALGIPVITSTACGVNDFYVRNGTNGFVVEPDDVDGAARFMSLLSDDETLWRQMATASVPFAEKGDAKHFAQSFDSLISRL